MQLEPAHWDDANQRWRDIAAQPYDEAIRQNYTYAQATVELEAGPSGILRALTATGLKPNFAYQIKLNGKPSALRGDKGDDGANEQLGRAGRWWARQIRRSDGETVRQWRSKDAEVDAWQAKGFADDEHDYVFEGYLLVGYLVTDAEGAATVPLRLDNSFHVLFRTDQRPPRPNDSTPTPHDVAATAASGWYGADLPPRTVELYAEWEPTRALPGQLVLPTGPYRCSLFLTEESFHEREAGSGQWATVMAADAVAFTIP